MLENLERTVAESPPGSRLLQSVALCKIGESKASREGWQFDCFYDEDNAALY